MKIKEKMKRMLACVLVLVFSAGCLPAGAAENEKEYTVMFYICGADLEKEYQVFSYTLEKIIESRYNRNAVNVIGLLGGTVKWKNNAFNPKALSVVEIGGRRPTTVDEMPLAPMSDPATLTSFLSYCHEHYPAKHYVLVMCDHGGGPLLGCITDYLFDESTMSVLSLKQALADSPFADRGLDIIAFNCCLMGSAEIANVLAPHVRYMVATEDAMYGMWQDWLPGMENDGSVLTTAGRLADSIYQYNKTRIAYGNEKELNSVSVIDLEAMKDVAAALDDYFAALPEPDEESFSRASAHRRDAVAFGVLESGGSSQFDLVDAGSLVVQMEEGGTGGDALLEAIRKAIPVRCSDVENCLGMTVYHPYVNKYLVEKYMDVYAELGFSQAYLNYLVHYIAIMTGKPLATWGTLLTEKPAAQKDYRTLFTLALTEEQAAHLGQARMKVFLKEANGGWRFSWLTPDTSFADGRITGEFSDTALYAVDRDGKALSGAIPYQTVSNGSFLIPAELTRISDGGTVTVRGLISCSPDPSTGTLKPGSVAVWDEAIQAYSGNMAPLFSDFSRLEIRIPIRKETRDEAGVLLPFDQWEKTGEEVWTAAVDDTWSFRMMKDTLDPGNLYAAFEVQDSQGNLYMSELCAVRGGPSSAAEVRVSYDDANLVRIGRLTVSVQNQIMLSAAVTNLTETEAIVALSNLTVNGIPVDAAAEAFGQGPNWGLLKDEEQMLAVLVPTEKLEGQETVKKITFDLVLKNAENAAELGSVPVEADLQLSLNRK